MKPKRTISANVLMVGITTLLMIGSIVTFQVYSALTKSQITPLQEKAIKPLDGKIKDEVVDNLFGRRWFNKIELDKPLVLFPPEASETGKVEER